MTAALAPLTPPNETEALIVRQPNVLLEKALAGGGRKLDEDALLRAHAAILKARETFLTVAEKDIERLGAAAAAVPADSAAVAAALQEVADIAHEIRNFGSTHGFPLLTTFGTSLYDFVNGQTLIDTVQREIIEHHVSAMRNVVRQRIDGNGGELGADLTAGLRAAVAKFSRQA